MQWHSNTSQGKRQNHGVRAVRGRASLMTALRAAEGERGQAAMFMAVIMGFTFIVGLLGINSATVVASRISAQRAADASALAGCLDLDGTEAAKAVASARAVYYAESADRNNTVGFTEGGNKDTSVSFASSGTTSTGAPLQNNKISVTVQRDQGLLGWAGIGLATKNVPAHAACIREEGFLPLFHTLSTGKDSFSQESSLTLNLPNGGIIVGSADCSPNRQLKVTGNGTITLRHLDVCSGADGCQTGCAAVVQPWPVTDHFMADPYASLPDPDKPTDVVINSQRSCEAYGGSWNNSRGCTMTGSVPAGYYPNGLVLYGKVTLDEGGFYYVSNGTTGQSGLDIQPNAEVTGKKVFFFNGMVGTKCSGIHIEHDATVLVTPPTSGTYQGLLIFQARDCTSTAGDMRIDSGVTFGYKDGPWGTVYVPNAMVNIGCRNCGDKAVDVNVRIVANQVALNGPLTVADIKIPSGTPWWGNVHLSE